MPNPQPKVAAKLAAEAAARAPQSRRKAAAQSQEQRNVAPEEKRGPEAIIFDGQIDLCGEITVVQDIATEPEYRMIRCEGCHKSVSKSGGWR